MKLEAGPLQDEVERVSGPGGPDPAVGIRSRYRPVDRPADDAVDVLLDGPAADDPDGLLLEAVLRHLDEPPSDEPVGLVQPDHLAPPGGLGRLGELVRSERSPVEVAGVVTRAALRRAGNGLTWLREDVEERRTERRAPHRRPPSGPLALPAMSDTAAAPRHYTDQELALWTISLVFQRARAAQRELRGLPPTGADDGTDPGPAATTPSGPDDGLDASLDAPVAVRTDETSPLPNPIITATNLRHHLDAAAANRGVAGSGPRHGAGRALALLSDHQARYNEAVINALHQLDHRTRSQSRTIATLEAELAEARRAIAALEAERDRP